MNQIVHARFDPFEAVAISFQVEQGRTIAEIVAACPDAPDWFWFEGEVRINDKRVARDQWNWMRPKPSRLERPVCITLHRTIHGGGGGSTKNILTTVAAIALVAGATLVSGGLLGPAGLGLLGASFAAGGIGANLAAAGLGLAATFLLSTLTPPPIKTSEQGREPTTQAGIGANMVRLLEPLSAVLGHIGYSPLQLAPAFTTLEDETLWVHAVVGLAGYYDEALITSSLKINGVDIDEIPQAEVQIRPGSPSDTEITICGYTVIEERRGRTLRNFVLDARDTLHLVHQDNPDLDLPQYQLFRTRGEADEIWIRLNWPAGIVDSSGTETSHMPLRIEIKERDSSTWLNMPTLHVKDIRKGRGTLRQEFKLKFVDVQPGGPRVNFDRGLNTYFAYSTTGDGQAFEYNSESYFANVAADAIPVMTSGTTSGVTMTADSTAGAGFEAWKASDNDPATTRWSSANTALPHWLKVQFGSAKTIKSYLINVSSNLGNWAKDWVLEGSNNDSTWTVVDSQTDIVNWPNYGHKLAFQVASPGSFIYYRLTVTEKTTTATNQVSIYDFQLSEADATGNNTNAIFASHVHLTRDGAEIYLDTATFPKGEYDVRVKRGLAIDDGNFDPDTYELSSNPIEANFFEYYNDGGIYKTRRAQNLISSECLIEQVSTVERVYPFNEIIHTKGVAMIAIRAPNLVIDSISAEFHSIVPIWQDGVWSTDAPSSNPAALRRHVLLGQENALALPGEILNEEQHQDFYEFCASEGHEFNAVIDGMSVLQVVQQVDAAGYGVAAFPSAQWGVIYEHDRSAETPVQVLTPVNTRYLSVDLILPKLPHAIRPEFFDEDDDWDMAEAPLVYMDGYDANSAERIEAFSYPGFTNLAKVQSRALFDLRQLYLRPKTYSLEIGLEGLVANTGDLVALVHDVTGRYFDYSRVKSIQTSGSDVTGLTLESRVNLGVAAGEVDTAMAAVIQIKDRTLGVHPVNEVTETDTVTFVTPFPMPLDGEGEPTLLAEDCVVGFKLAGFTTDHMVVKGIEYVDLFNRRITLVDEARGLHA